MPVLPDNDYKNIFGIICWTSLKLDANILFHNDEPPGVNKEPIESGLVIGQTL